MIFQVDPRAQILQFEAVQGLDLGVTMAGGLVDFGVKARDLGFEFLQLAGIEVKAAGEKIRNHGSRLREQGKR